MCGLTFALTGACCQDVVLGTEPPSLHHLYLLHPAFPSILLDLANATGTVTASEGRSQGRWGLCTQRRGVDVLAVVRVIPSSHRGEGVCLQMTAGRVCRAAPVHFPWWSWFPGAVARVRPPSARLTG